MSMNSKNVWLKTLLMNSKNVSETEKNSLIQKIFTKFSIFMN